MRDARPAHDERGYGWLTLLVLLLAVVTVEVGVGAISYLEVRLLASAGKSLELMAANIADKLDQTLFERYGDIQVLAQVLSTKMGHPAAMAQDLIRTRDLYLVYDWVGVTDAEGRVVAATDPATVGMDQSRADWFLAVKQEPGVHLTDVSRFEETRGETAVGFSAPITDATGRFLGAVTSRVALRQLEDVFRRTVERFKAQQDGPIRVEWQFLTSAGDLITDSRLREEWKVNLRQLGLPSALRVHESGEPGYVEERHLRRGLDVITGYAHTEGYMDFPGLHWGILVRADRDELLSPIQSLLRALRLVALAVIGPLLAGLLWVTNRLRREWAVASSRGEQLSAILASVGEAVIMVDRDGRIAFVNAEAERLTGWPCQVATGQPWRSIVTIGGGTDEAQRAVDQVVSDILTHGTVRTLSARAVLVHLGGEARPVEGIGTPVLDRGGRVTGMVLSLRDTTERHRQEVALREAALRFQAVMESAQDVIVIADEQGTILSWNPAGVRLFGYTAEELLGQPLTTLLPERYLGSHRHAFERARAAAGSSPGRILEVHGRRKDGREVSLECTIAAWSGGPARYFCGIMRDISERSRHEQRLAAQYAVTRVLAASPLIEDAATQILQAVCNHLEWECGVLWLVDPSTEVLRCRTIWVADPSPLEPFVTATRDRVFPSGIGLPGRVWATGEPAWIEELAAASNFPRLPAAVSAGLRSGFAFPVQGHERMLGVLEFFSRSGQAPDPVLLNLLTGVGSQIGQFVERKQLEDALRDGEAQLRQAQKMEAIGQLAGGVAHDFNNLLTVINGHSDLLLDTLPAGSPEREGLAQIRQAGERAAALTQQLLAFSRRQTLLPKIVDLNDTIRAMHVMLGRLLGEDIVRRMELAPDRAWISIDPGQLDQVIMNLAINARDAMPQGGTLTLATHLIEGVQDWPVGASERAAGPYVQLSVTDTGCGMEAETLARLFEPFFTTKEQGKGTGLGLATVYGIVKQHRGFITVQSEPGRGTSFRIALPWVGPPQETHGTGASASPVGVAGVGGPATLLVVEDEQSVRELVVGVLTGLGYRTLEAESGPAALTLAAEFPDRIHLLVTDVIMPGMSGPELARRLTARDPALNVLFMSGYAGTELARYGFDESAVAFLPKPFMPEALARAVRDVLGPAPNDEGGGDG